MLEKELEGPRVEGLKSQILERVSLLSSNQIPSGRPTRVEGIWMVASRMGEFDLQPAVKCVDGCSADKTEVVVGYLDAWNHPVDHGKGFLWFVNKGHHHHSGRGFIVFSNNDHSEMLDFEEGGIYQVGKLGEEKKKAKINDLDFFNGILDKVMSRRIPTAAATT